MLCQFIVLWMPMFLSSLTLSISNPGFTFGCEPNKDMNCMASVCLVLMDLSVFYLHPIILRWRISVLTKEQEGIDKSRNLALSQKYEKNAKILDRLNAQFFAFKKLELNLGGLHLLYLASVDCWITWSNGTTVIWPFRKIEQIRQVTTIIFTQNDNWTIFNEKLLLFCELTHMIELSIEN